MIFIIPSRLFVGGAFQELQKLLPANLITRSLYQEGTPSPRPDQGVDFPKQLLGQKNVGAPCPHSVYI
jgi:hypothetical protein